MDQSLLRSIPKVDALLRTPEAEALRDSVSESVLTNAVRAELDELRASVLSGAADAVPDEKALLSRIRTRALSLQRHSLRSVINATGVILHTNLGRSCMGKKAVSAVIDAAEHYSTLEYDVEAGSRGHRYSHVESLLTKLTGAEAGFVVNNNAAAVLLLLSALTSGGEVVVSRGELVEIGGAFRVPDIMESCGAVLKEVGTTNKTKLSDFARAIGESTKALLKVHTSNYRIVGFTESVPREELVRLGHENGLYVFEDLGSGSLLELDPIGIHDEPTVQKSVSSGMDVVTFSGDKLLGGPQAGILVGKRAAIEALRSHPLARAMRVDKMTLAALESVLRSYDEHTEAEDIPSVRMLFAAPETLRARADVLASAVNGFSRIAEVIPTEDQVGGGSVPTKLLPDFAVALKPAEISVEELEKRLRLGNPSVIGRMENGRLLLQMRTLLEGDEIKIAEAVREALE